MVKLYEYFLFSVFERCIVVGTARLGTVGSIRRYLL